MAEITLLKKLLELPQVESASLLGCSPPWISRLVHHDGKPSRKLLERAAIVWPGLDVRASEEEFLSPTEISSRRGRDLARMVLAIPPGSSVASGYMERLRAAANSVMEVPCV